jgi:hypothetical protein
MKTVLAVVCSSTVLATVFLSLSLAVLHPPRANYVEWSRVAALFLAQGALTMVALARPATAEWMRWLLLAGAAAIMWVGGSWALSTINSSHFEGYAVVLGSALVVQGMLTIPLFLRLGIPRWRS